MQEIVANAAVDIKNTIIFDVNYSKVVIDAWQDLIILFNGRCYKPEGKPDEFDYASNKGSMQIRALQFADNNVYSSDEYKEG